MKIDQLQSSQICPDFVQTKEWFCGGLDQIVKSIAERRAAVAAPTTWDSLKALTDSELEHWYNLVSPIPYYANISRKSRELILYHLVNPIYTYINPMYNGYISQILNLAFDEKANIYLDDTFNFDDQGTYSDIIDSNDMYKYIVHIEPHEAWYDSDDEKLTECLDNLARVTCSEKYREYTLYARWNQGIGLSKMKDNSCYFNITFDLGTVTE